MHPIVARFEVLGWGIVLPAYGTFLLLAALVAGALAVRAASGPAVGLSRRRALVLVAVAVGSGLVGARLLDVVLDWGAYAADPDLVWALEPRGSRSRVASRGRARGRWCWRAGSGPRRPRWPMVSRRRWHRGSC